MRPSSLLCAHTLDVAQVVPKARTCTLPSLHLSFAQKQASNSKFFSSFPESTSFIFDASSATPSIFVVISHAFIVINDAGSVQDHAVSVSRTALVRLSAFTVLAAFAVFVVFVAFVFSCVRCVRFSQVF